MDSRSWIHTDHRWRSVTSWMWRLREFRYRLLSCQLHPFSFASTGVETTMMTSSNRKNSALLAICVGNSPVPGEFPTQRPATRSFGVFFDLRLNKRLSKQSWSWCFETPPCPLWHHSNGHWEHSSVEWFSTNGTKANPNKFQFMILSPN